MLSFPSCLLMAHTPGPKYLLSLMFVLLRHHLLLVKMCTTVSLDPRELPSSCENICQVLNVVNARVVYLEGCFAQRNDQLARFLKFASGMFSEWRVYLVDPIQQPVEESPLDSSSEDISFDDLDRFRDLLRYSASGPIPVTRPLPIARVSTTGELLPRSLMPLQGMTLLFWQA
jgi:hypothetical protein